MVGEKVYIFCAMWYIAHRVRRRDEETKLEHKAVAPDENFAVFYVTVIGNI